MPIVAVFSNREGNPPSAGNSYGKFCFFRCAGKWNGGLALFYDHQSVGAGDLCSQTARSVRERRELSGGIHHRNTCEFDRGPLVRRSEVRKCCGLPESK
jgi:hypothetical protein